MNKKILVIAGILILIFAAETSALVTIKGAMDSHIGTSISNIISMSPGDHFRLMFHEWRIRSYRIHIPPSYDGSTELPLVLALHGGGGRSKSMESKTGFDEKADKEGFIAAYPNGVCGLFPLRTWNVGFCCGKALEKNVDDVGFIEKLIDSLQNRLNIDSAQIYVTGHSNGAMMAYRIAAELSDTIAAIAPVAGTIGGYENEDSEVWIIPEPSNPVSVIAVHGKLDENLPYDGGRGNNTGGNRSYLSVGESIYFWVQHNECNSFPERSVSESENIVIDTYVGGQHMTEVSLVTIMNGEHWWPGSDKDPYHEISATDIIWDFFENHPKQ